MDELLHVMARLRDPEGGCAWDRAQDFRSLIPYLLEESYEVADLLEQGEPDVDALRGELGDLLFQVVFHSRLAEERGWFDFGAVAAGMADKLVRRHPHVFADTDLGHDPARWDAIKDEERQAAGASGGVLADVPAALPALMRAQKLGRRAARVGFDWRRTAAVLAKVREELDELEAALAEEEPPSGSRRNWAICSLPSRRQAAFSRWMPRWPCGGPMPSSSAALDGSRRNWRGGLAPRACASGAHGSVVESGKTTRTRGLDGAGERACVMG